VVVSIAIVNAQVRIELVREKHLGMAHFRDQTTPKASHKAYGFDAPEAMEGSFGELCVLDLFQINAIVVAAA
jgi:hypothetical protein